MKLQDGALIQYRFYRAKHDEKLIEIQKNEGDIAKEDLILASMEEKKRAGSVAAVKPPCSNMTPEEFVVFAKPYDTSIHGKFHSHFFVWPFATFLTLVFPFYTGNDKLKAGISVAQLAHNTGYRHSGGCRNRNFLLAARRHRGYHENGILVSTLYLLVSWIY